MFRPIDSDNPALEDLLAQIRLKRREREQRMAEYYNFDFSKGIPLPPESSSTRRAKFEWEPVVQPSEATDSSAKVEAECHHEGDDCVGKSCAAHTNNIQAVKVATRRPRRCFN